MIAPPPAKRKRLTRARTGCRECRRLHVKCAEGALLAAGKAACKRCWATDQACWYPSPAGGYPSSRTRRAGGTRAARNVELGERSWERAVDVGAWVGASSGSSASPGDGETPYDDAETPEVVSPAPEARRSKAPPTPWAIASTTGVPQHVFDSAPWYAPQPPLATFTLAALSSCADDRAAVAYFELRGCNDITAAARPADNWIHACLLPRLLELLAGGGMMREYAHAALLQLSYAHRANTEAEGERAAVLRAKACAARERGTCALLRARARGEAGDEEYLVGSFVRCIADVLSCARLELGSLPPPASSPLASSLPDLMATYGIVQYACAPLDAVCSAPELGEPVALGTDWTAAAFGCSRAGLRLLARVSGLVRRRSALLRAGGGGEPLLAAEAAALAAQLASPLDEAGPSRVQRGSMVMRHALHTLLLCEVLDVPLDDARLAADRDAAAELVADCDAASMTGFQWQLAVLAIYTPGPEDRERLARLLALALGMGFGPNYRGTRDVLDVCWDVLDARGRYEHGIAPWREAMHALGRNVWV
ncbi:hypothetical protein Q8F55_008566 [Vanrija albida]|uniref:Zn(2)-C6 fungal-type domain-containing protein n=1 Tax=Vanrija albida TaxID=181172 RepID=A0ABR3PR78_9TREE